MKNKTVIKCSGITTIILGILLIITYIIIPIVIDTFVSNTEQAAVIGGADASTFIFILQNLDLVLESSLILILLYHILPFAAIFLIVIGIILLIKSKSK